MTKPKPRTLTHPRSNVTVEADRDHVDVYLSQGWVEQTAKPTKKPDDE